MGIIIKIAGWLLIGTLIFYLVKLLNKLGLVSNDAAEGKETKNIRIAKYTLLGVVLLLIAGYFIFFVI